MIDRIGWDGLSPGLRARIEEYVGAVYDAVTVADGLNCRLAATVTTERHGELFLKGVPDEATDEAAALHREALLNPAVTGIGPRLRHDIRTDGWRVLVFEWIDGRHAELGPNSGDLDAVRNVLDQMRGLRPPTGVAVPPLTERFAGFLGPGDAELLAGEALLHTDTNPHNILVTDPGQSETTRRAYVVDWAMPATGPDWIDAAYTAVRLMECDQPPHTALGWLATVPAWQAADPAAVRAFVNTVCRHWTAVAGEQGSGWSNECYRQLLPEFTLS
ncbi:aminoglycoside phosphotransferase [Streptomyces sp. NPDC058953]|uniref:aminoglycoside phosphotransferase n=1 Tax=unclassified Streptomyces TaxID=2593676 RepID=UPI00368EC623